jgi:hypothetical protein
MDPPKEGRFVTKLSEHQGVKVRELRSRSVEKELRELFGLLRKMPV